jgi:hypothetical protein
MYFVYFHVLQYSYIYLILRILYSYQLTLKKDQEHCEKIFCQYKIKVTNWSLKFR